MLYARKQVTKEKVNFVDERRLRIAARDAAMWDAFRRGEITFTMNTPEGVKIIRTEEELRAIYHLSPRLPRQPAKDSA